MTAPATAPASTNGRSKTIHCPHCGEKFTKQGFPGHMRFQHGDKIAGLAVEAPPAPIAPQPPTLLALIEQLKHVREQLAEFEHDESDPTLEDCCETLKVEELRLRNEIRKSRGARPLERVIKHHWWHGDQEVYQEVGSDLADEQNQDE